MRVLLPAKAVAAAVRTDLLLVEGDPAVRELARRVLEAAGFRVEAVEAAPDAAGERDYAVVVLDLPEPATDCDELLRAIAAAALRAIAAAAPRATLVLTSGHDGPGILAKPYRPQELVERVRAALRPKAE
jgi:DNA-binding response OmpR family regulator